MTGYCPACDQVATLSPPDPLTGQRRLVCDGYDNCGWTDDEGLRHYDHATDMPHNCDDEDCEWMEVSPIDVAIIQTKRIVPGNPFWDDRTMGEVVAGLWRKRLGVTV